MTRVLVPSCSVGQLWSQVWLGPGRLGPNDNLVRVLYTFIRDRVGTWEPTAVHGGIIAATREVLSLAAGL